MWNHPWQEKESHKDRTFQMKKVEKGRMSIEDTCTIPEDESCRFRWMKGVEVCQDLAHSSTDGEDRPLVMLLSSSGLKGCAL